MRKTKIAADFDHLLIIVTHLRLCRFKELQTAVLQVTNPFFNQKLMGLRQFQL